MSYETHTLLVISRVGSWTLL